MTARSKLRFGDSRDQMAAPPNDAKHHFNHRSSMPPRTRDGKEFPGGKAMRKALKKLSLRQRAFVPEAPGAKHHKRCKPGSMKSTACYG